MSRSNVVFPNRSRGVGARLIQAAARSPFSRGVSYPRASPPRPTTQPSFPRFVPTTALCLMPFSIETPLSYVRSTADITSFVDKCRRRPTFSLHIDTNAAHSFRVAPSQFTTPALSPSQSFVLSPSPLGSLPRTPVTPDQWLNVDDRNLTESFATPNSPTSSIEHGPAYNPIRSGNKDHDVLFANHQPIFTPHPLPQGNFSERNSILSVPQEGTDIEQRLSNRVKNDDSPRVAPRLSGPRSTQSQSPPTVRSFS
ncbi:unnamed protein product [Rhizoctonia solani]|uniref:Uncharacterized protein n=1 Tax=Rhizoctonia solani TaxID=456999 RepID=A0A8H3HRR7_9AGAM|nr:unnamed protein product [Rhizoctonia solani]